ncbi:MAG: nicotinate-nucleotide adenylyltransferase [Gammaproteobacteria bacterium]|nr:nicotinate-nucleotide adenylyltransferase [Gammaproteobacteria bacterium]
MTVQVYAQARTDASTQASGRTAAVSGELSRANPKRRHPVDTVTIGVLGGTFDPIHCGHLRLAIEVRDQLGLTQVNLLPAPNPRLRDAPQVDASVRLTMLRLAVEGVEGLVADPRELSRSGETRTVDTIEELCAEHPERTPVLILGADAFSRFEQWVRYERILELAGIAVARRPGATISVSPALRGRCIDVEDGQSSSTRCRAAPGVGQIAVCDIPALDISATAIRQMRASGRSIRFLVPDSVHEFLVNEGLYLHA